MRHPTAGLLSVSIALIAGCTQAPNETSAPTSPTSTAAPTTRPYSDQDVSDAYIYLLGRMLVLRQEQTDFKEGFKWNQLVHRKPGAVDWPNPNLDVAYSEAWINVDANSCTIVSVPAIAGRYYTVQFLNGWGETLANINERTQPRGAGDYAACLKGANVTLPANTTRIDLPVRQSRLLARVELGNNRDEAVSLDHKFALRATSTPATPTQLPQIPDFDMERLPDAAAFEAAPAVLDSEPDTNPGMADVAQKVRTIATAIKDPAERKRVDGLIHEKAWTDFAKASPTIGHGTTGNHWARPAVSGTYNSDWLGRTLVNFAGIWANTMDEVVYYKGNLDSTGTQLNGDHVYTLTFPASDLPPKYAHYFWSVIAVDTRHMRVLPNPQNRFLLNNQSGLKYNADGSLTLYFAPEKPADAPDPNWLPTPRGEEYRLTFRFYGPRGGVADGSYFPPPIIKRS